MRREFARQANEFHQWLADTRAEMMEASGSLGGWVKVQDFWGNLKLLEGKVWDFLGETLKFWREIPS